MGKPPRQVGDLSSTSYQETVVVLDNGGSTCKVGLQGQQQPVKVFPNCTARAKGERGVYVGDQLLDCQDLSSLAVRRPIDRGYVVNWDVEKEVWGRAFQALLKVQPPACGLMLTEPLFNLPSIAETTDQVVFEEFGFARYYSAPTSLLALRHHAQQQPQLPANQAMAGLVLDSGFSFTHAVPVFDGHVLEGGVRRINLGGKALTNYLKELVSYRSINMMEESYLVEVIKEAVCFVSQDMRADLVRSRLKPSPHRLEYVLPNGVNSIKGYIRGPADALTASKAESKEQVLTVNNERFMVPEALFHPSDIGMEQAGLAETVVEAVEAAPSQLHALLYSNILLTGGNVLLPGFKERLYSELRPLVPEDYELNITLPFNPVTVAWQGAASFAASPDFMQVAYSRAEYLEQGSARLHSISAD